MFPAYPVGHPAGKRLRQERKDIICNEQPQQIIKLKGGSQQVYAT